MPLDRLYAATLVALLCGVGPACSESSETGRTEASGGAAPQSEGAASEIEAVNTALEARASTPARPKALPAPRGYTPASAATAAAPVRTLVNGVYCPEANDSIEYKTCGAPPSMVNGIYTLPDLTIASPDPEERIKVALAPALAGGIASIKYRGQELIATGGHGASFQFALHPTYPYYTAPTWSGGFAPTECDNPTEAGTQSDGLAEPLSPWMAQSSSVVQRFDQNSRQYASTQVNMAYFVPEGESSSYNSSCAPYWAGNGGYVKGKTSGFILTKHAALGRTIAGQMFPNVLTVDTSIHVPRAVSKMDSVLVAYLTSRLKNQLIYYPVTGQMWIKPVPVADNASVSPLVRIYADDAWGTAIGVLVPPKTMSVHESGLPRIYTANNAEIAAVPGYNYIFRNIAAMHYFEGIPANSDVHVHSYWVIGSVDEIKAAAQAFCQEWGCWK
jgi:hypothetical protein